MSRMPKILLLDSNALIHRSFHALPPLTTPKGEQVNAVYGFANALLKAIKDEKPDYVVACFDVGGDRGTFRSEIYKDYKAHRKESDQALTLQIPRVKEIVETLNIPLFAQAGVEADDLIGSLTKIAAKKGIESVIVTGDNDALQLVNDSTSVYSLHRGVTDTLSYHREDVKNKIGVYPNQIIDYKALAGDSSDNIPGAPGVGPKTAVDLLNKYGTLDEIYKHLDELKERTAKILADNKDQVYMSQELATIKCDLDIDLDLKAAEVSNFDFTKVVALFHELDFKSLLGKLPTQAPSVQGELFGNREQKKVEQKVIPSLPFEAVTTATRWRELQTILRKQPLLAIDTETVDIDGDLVGIVFAWGENDAAYLPLSPAYAGGVPLSEIKDSIQEVLGNTDIKKVGHNIKYDLRALMRAGFTVANVWFDTMLASQMANSQAFSHGLDALAFSELGFRKIPTMQLLQKKDSKMTEVPLDDLAAYACEDGLVTWRLYQKFFPLVEERGIKRVFYDIEMPLLPILAQMEETGVKIDKSYLEKLGKDWREKLQIIEKQTWQAAGKEFNIASPSQLQKILFEDLNLPVVGVKKIKTGYSTDAETLAKLKDKHPVVARILEYRELAKLLNTYVETLPKQADSHDRVHTSFIQLGAATGRMASTDPNLQNIPIRTELGNQVRRAFIADKGKVLLGADYSQAELRVLAHLSGDPLLIEAFQNKADFHAAVAQRLGVDRRAAKAINFGIIYGLGPQALGNDIGMSMAEAKDFIDKYFETFPGVKVFIEKMKRLAREQGYVTTEFGRRRYLPDIHSPNMMLRSAAERMAVNMPCQGMVADLVKMAMVEVSKKLPNYAKLLLQIHDELLFEVEADRADELDKLVAETMEQVAELKVPLIADVHIGTNWAQLKG